MSLEGGREGREGGRKGEREEGRGEEGRGGTTVFKLQTRHVLRNNVSRCLPMAPQYLNNNHVTYYVIT